MQVKMVSVEGSEGAKPKGLRLEGFNNSSIKVAYCITVFSCDRLIIREMH